MVETVIGISGAEKWKMKSKDNQKSTDKVNLDQKIYITDLERRIKEQENKTFFFPNAWTAWKDY